MHPRLLVAVLALAAAARAARADAFDNYTNPILAKVPAAEGVRELKQLTPALIADHDRVLPGVSGALLVVRTNDLRWSKLLVQAARQKADGGRTIPLLLVERFVTYKDGEERAVQANGKNLYLFPGFRLNLDIGQVVPEELGGDLRLVADGDKVYAETLGKARMYLVTKPLPEATPKKQAKLVVGETFEPRYYNGTYKLYDDGRRSGTLTLKAEDGGALSGSYYSDKDGAKYEVHGKIGTPRHAFQFTIQFPRSEQTFQGWMFTGDGKVLTGSSKLLDREAGFYAVRVEQ
jgi:hypothetical protein